MRSHKKALDQYWNMEAHMGYKTITMQDNTGGTVAIGDHVDAKFPFWNIM